MINYEVLIPAYNAGDKITELIRQLQLLDHKPSRILIIDDGSNDDTAVKAGKMNAEVLKVDQNTGKGSALRRGFDNFLKTSNADYLICMDADLQHPPAAIPKFIEVIENENAYLVIGHRSREMKKMPFARIISNTLTSIILSWVTKQSIKDSQCGFRCIKRDLLQQVHLNQNGFQMETEFILKAAAIGASIHFVKIPTIYNGSISNIKHLGDTLTFIKLVAHQLSGRN